MTLAHNSISDAAERICINRHLVCLFLSKNRRMLRHIAKMAGANGKSFA
jgi:hypothetical protein